MGLTSGPLHPLVSLKAVFSPVALTVEVKLEVKMDKNQLQLSLQILFCCSWKLFDVFIVNCVKADVCSSKRKISSPLIRAGPVQGNSEAIPQNHSFKIQFCLKAGTHQYSPLVYQEHPESIASEGIPFPLHNLPITFHTSHTQLP